MQGTPLLLTPEVAAERLSCGRTKVYELIRTGALESVKVGRLRRVPVDALNAYVASLRRKESDES